MGWVCLCPSEFGFFNSSKRGVLMDFRLGIEGLVMFKRDTEFDADNYTITVDGKVQIAVFDKVVVNIEVEKDRNTQRGKVKMTLVEPIDSRSL